MGQRLGKACRLVDLAHSDARLKKSNYRELGLDSTVAKFRPSFGYIIFFNLASLFARSTRWHAFPNLWCRGDGGDCQQLCAFAASPAVPCVRPKTVPTLFGGGEGGM